MPPVSSYLFRKQAIGVREHYQAQVTTDDATESRTSATWWAVVAINVAALCYPILHFRGLFADGAPLLLQLVSTGAPYADPPRTAAVGLLQSPTIMAVGVHAVSSIRAAAWVYSGSLLAMPWVILIAGVAFLSPRYRVLAWFPVLSMLAAYLLASLFSVSEVFVAASLWWGVLLFILGGDLTKRRWPAMFAAVAMALLLAFAYEPLAMLAVLLVVVLAARYATTPRDARSGVLFPVIILSLTLAITCVVGASWTLHPAQAYRRSALQAGIPFRSLLKSYSVQLVALASLLGLSTIRMPTRRDARQRQRLRWTLWVVFALAFFALGQRLPVVTPPLQFHARLLVPLVVVALSAAAVLAREGLERRWWSPTDISRWVMPMVACLSVVHVWWQFEATRGWQAYTDAVAAARQPGKVIEAPQLALQSFQWPWAQASLSILLTGMEHATIDGIVFASSTVFPFEPRCPARWPSLERIGVHYRAESTACTDVAR